jgi:plastocyanin
MFGLRLVVVSTVLMTAVACGGGSSSPAPSPSPSPTPTPGSSSAVAIPVGASALGKNAFSPDELQAAVGATVTWTNTDSVSHTSTSDSGVWNSGVVAPGAKFSVAFPTAGTFPYHCAIHPGMIGTVVVR